MKKHVGLSYLVGASLILNLPQVICFSFQAMPAWNMGSQRLTYSHLEMAKKPQSLNLEELEKLEALFDKSEEDEDENSISNEDDDMDWDDMASIHFIIPEDLSGTRIDNALQSLITSHSEASSEDGVDNEGITISRSQCSQLLSDGCVRVAGQGVITKKSHQMQTGDELIVFAEDSIDKGGKDKELSVESLISGLVNRGKGGLTEEEMIRPQDIPLSVLFEDEHMIVVNKQAGIVVHPAAGNWDGTLVNAVAHHLLYKSKFGSGEFVVNESENGVKDENGESLGLRPGIVHRLDKGTTGLIIVAKTRQALGALSDAFANRRVKKTYLCVTVGNPGDNVTIDKPIGRHPLYRQKMRVVPDPTKGRQRRVAPRFQTEKSPAQVGRRALSFVQNLAFNGKLSISEVRIETGRTHQIRVHLQDRGTPIYGDDVYGISDWNKKLSKQRGILRPLLHAYKLEISHPITGKDLVFCAPMAEDMATIVDTIWPTGRDERPELF